METLKFRDKDLLIKIQLNEKDYFDCCKDENFNGSVMAIVTEFEGSKNKHLCTYYKVWYDLEQLNTLTYSTFAKKFLEDIEFRNTLECFGTPWNGTIKFSNENGVNIKCANKITSLNNKKNPKFKDFAQLKSFGFDKYSRMKYDKLVELVDENSLKIIKNSFDDEHLIIKALRWNIRGLLPHLSIRKVKTDLEITNNRK